MIEKIRKGNDIEVLWAIYAGEGVSEAPYDLTGKNLSLYLNGPLGRKEVYGFSVDRHILKWVFWGKDQYHNGTYSLELVENEGREGMHTVDECDAFQIVKCSCDANSDSEGRVECVHLQFRSSMSVGYPSVSGPAIVVDDALSQTSTNPVQNKVVTGAINELNSKVDNLIDNLLFPVVNPTFTEPSASIKFSNYASVKEVGSTGPQEDNFSVSFNPGEITLSGAKQNNRAGAQDMDNSFVYINDDVQNITLPTIVSEGSMTFKYRAAYNEGAQPKDSKGNNYSTPLSAGYVDSNAITLNGTWPWFASTSNANEQSPTVKQSLISWSSSMSTGQFTLQPSGTLAQVFKLPRQLKTLQMLNTVSDKMETIDASIYTETTEVLSVNGIERTYYVYTYNGSARGSVTLLAKF